MILFAYVKKEFGISRKIFLKTWKLKIARNLYELLVKFYKLLTLYMFGNSYLK